jgi:hypothetical protein
MTASSGSTSIRVLGGGDDSRATVDPAAAMTRPQPITVRASQPLDVIT